MRIIPGVRQLPDGSLYQAAFETDERGEDVGREVMLPYVEQRRIVYVPGSMAQCTDYFLVTEHDGSTRVL